MSLKEKFTRVMPWNWGKEPVESHSSPAASLPALRRDIDSMFDVLERDFLSSWSSLPTVGGLAEDLWGTGWPQVDLEETEEEIRVTAEVPGVEEKDLEVTVDDDVLTIRGQRQDTREDREGGYYRRESWSGSFHRSIRLPAPVEAGQAEATCHRGELTVRMPKKSADRSDVKRITVH